MWDKTRASSRMECFVVSNEVWLPSCVAKPDRIRFLQSPPTSPSPLAPCSVSWQETWKEGKEGDRPGILDSRNGGGPALLRILQSPKFWTPSRPYCLPVAVCSAGSKAAFRVVRSARRPCHRGARAPRFIARPLPTSSSTTSSLLIQSRRRRQSGSNFLLEAFASFRAIFCFPRSCRKARLHRWPQISVISVRTNAPFEAHLSLWRFCL